MALLAMRFKPQKMVFKNGNPLQMIKEGFDYAFNFPPIRAILGILIELPDPTSIEK
jgi:hypothetical protein